MKIAVNTKTQKEWNEVTKKLGYIWRMSKWNDYKENSCICLHGNAYSSMKYLKKEGYKIISYDEFMGNKNKEYKLIITPTNTVESYTIPLYLLKRFYFIDSFVFTSYFTS
jgi:hypothetical protein